MNMKMNMMLKMIRNLAGREDRLAAAYWFHQSRQNPGQVEQFRMQNAICIIE